MKDSIALLLTGILCAAAAWMFWRYAGEYGGPIITIVAVVSLFLDNRRLRRKLRDAGISER